jgi:hypothetical protein
VNVLNVTDSAVLGWAPGAAVLSFPLMAVRDGVVDFDLAPKFHETLLEAGVLMAGSQGGRAVLMGDQTWVVTCDPERVAAWAPACGCEPCEEHKRKCIAAMIETPGTFIAFCDMTYVIIHRS